MIRLLIADDHHLVRQGIRALIEKQMDITVVGEAKDGLEALAFTSQLQPDILLIDINMPKMNGIDVVKSITELELDTAAVILSMYSDESLVKKAFYFGAWGYLLKNDISDDLVSAVTAAYHREYFLSPELREIFSSGELETIRLQSVPVILVESLTGREKEIFQLIAQGLTNQAIAISLNISPKTVEKHRANLMSKLGVQDLVSLIREGLRQGLIFLEE